VREAEEKLAAIRTWLIRLESDGKDLLAQCQGHAESLDDLADRASRHLDRLATDIDAYLERPAS
jgi:hypothetical protein